METQIRSLVKAVSWRIVGTADTFILSWVVTEQIRTAGIIATVEVVTKIAIYWAHERIWNKVTWQKNF